VIALGHLREIKDPLLAAQAARMLPAHSRIRIEHYGSSLDVKLARKARAESRQNPRWRWRGERSHAEVLRVLARSDVFVQTSFAEGGSSAMSEAITRGLAVLSTRNPGAVGMLGNAHPGFFPAGDASALAELLMRCEREAGFLRRLRTTSKARAPLFAPEREREAWFSILRDLGLAEGRPSHPIIV
jgi:glycosyltransferase involved in cell wall biosynthesis